MLAKTPSRKFLVALQRNVFSKDQRRTSAVFEDLEAGLEDEEEKQEEHHRDHLAPSETQELATREAHPLGLKEELKDPHLLPKVVGHSSGPEAAPVLTDGCVGLWAPAVGCGRQEVDQEVEELEE